MRDLLYPSGELSPGKPHEFSEIPYFYGLWTMPDERIITRLSDGLVANRSEAVYVIRSFANAE